MDGLPAAEAFRGGLLMGHALGVVAAGDRPSLVHNHLDFTVTVHGQVKVGAAPKNPPRREFLSICEVSATPPNRQSFLWPKPRTQVRPMARAQTRQDSGCAACLRAA